MVSYEKKIKVLIVDDSILFREVIKRGISNDQYITVVGSAADPYEARDMILEFEPDVVTLDVQMPKMSGIEFLKRLLPQYPIPVIVVSSVSDHVFDALNAGAVDFVTKPDATKQENLTKFMNELIMKIKIASVSKIKLIKEETVKHKFEKITSNNKFIAVGASTGGTEAFYNILKTLCADTPGIVVVQHMPPVFTRMYAERLDRTCEMSVKEAQDGDRIIKGQVLIAPGGYHMTVHKDKDGGYYVKCSQGDNVNGHCPSVDVMFESIAKYCAKDAIGVILTGMGSDGAKGLLNMKKGGSYTIGQDEKSSVVYGMPMVAYNIGAVIKQVPLDKVPEEIYAVLK